MIKFLDAVKLETESAIENNLEFTVDGKSILERSIFLDLEHYIYKKPICIGIFGAAYIKNDELKIEQYFLEDSKDSKVLTKEADKRLIELRNEGYDYLVTFAGKNDLMVLNTMFRKFEIETDLRKQFKLIDIQREFEKEFHIGIGLKPLEKLMGINREGGEISGSSIAKTFARIMKDPGHIKRMDKNKIHRLIEYNKEDVIDLYFILKNWRSLNDELIGLYISEKERLKLLSSGIAGEED